MPVARYGVLAGQVVDRRAEGGTDTRITRFMSGAVTSSSGWRSTLLDPDGLKVDGVAYTKAHAGREGWSLVF
jgi:hypothetical protein